MLEELAQVGEKTEPMDLVASMMAEARLVQD